MFTIYLFFPIPHLCFLFFFFSLLSPLSFSFSFSLSLRANKGLFSLVEVDAYRNKMRSSMMGSGQDVTVAAPHLETRAGKRKWLERERRSMGKRGGSAGESAREQ